MSLRTWLLHKKIVLFGDEVLIKNGKIIPCRDCDAKFKSYAHFGDFSYTYDSLCKKCVARRKNKMINEKDRTVAGFVALACTVVFILGGYILLSNHPEPSKLTFSKFDYWQAINTFDLKPIYSTNCSDKSTPIEYVFVTVEGGICNYYDTRILDYYLACVKLNHDKVLGAVTIDECGALSVPVKVK